MASFGDHVKRLLQKMAKQDQHESADSKSALDGSEEARLKQLSDRAAQAADVNVDDSEFLGEPPLPMRNKEYMQGNFGKGSAKNEYRKNSAPDLLHNIIYDREESQPNSEAHHAISFNRVISHRHLGEAENAKVDELESAQDEPDNASAFAERLLGQDKEESSVDWTSNPQETLGPGKCANPTEESYKQVASCPTTSPSTLTWLASQSSREIRAAVASNHVTPQDSLRKLASDAESSVRLAVASNRSTGEDILRFLTHDESRLVSGEAHSALSMREKTSPQSSSSPAFNKFAPPKVNPVQTKVPIIGGGTNTKQSLPAVPPGKPPLPAPNFSRTGSLPGTNSSAASPSAPLNWSDPKPSPSSPSLPSTPAPKFEAAPSLPAPPAAQPAPFSSPTSSAVEAVASSASASPPTPPPPPDSPLPSTPAARTSPSSPTYSTASSPITPPPSPTPVPGQAPAAKSSSLQGAAIPRSLPKPTVKAPPPKGIPGTTPATRPLQRAPLKSTPPVFADIAPVLPPAELVKTAETAGSVEMAAKAPPPAVAPAGADKKPVQFSADPPPAPDGHDLLASNRFKTTSNHLVASYTDLEAISVEMEARSPNSWLSLNSEVAMKAYKKQKDTVKDVKMNLSANNPNGPKRTSPLVNITPNASASETIAFLKLVAARVSTPPGRLIELAEHANEEVRAAVAENTNLPNDAFMKLAKDAVSTVKLRLIDNAACPTEVLANLQNDSDPYVAFEARNALKRISRGLLKEREQQHKSHGQGSHTGSHTGSGGPIA